MMPCNWNGKSNWLRLPTKNVDSAGLKPKPTNQTARWCHFPKCGQKTARRHWNRPIPGNGDGCNYLFSVGKFLKTRQKTDSESRVGGKISCFFRFIIAAIRGGMEET